MLTRIEKSQSFLSRRITHPVRRGDYTPVAYETPLHTGESPRIVWFDGRNGIVTETLGPPKPFRMLWFDFDGSLVDSEGMHGIFGVAWRSLLREAGLCGSDQNLESLRKRVYRWQDTLPTSALKMTERIQQGMDIFGNPLRDEERTALRQLLRPERLRHWADMNQRDYGNNPVGNAHLVLADRKEAIGEAILRENPQMVHTLAPIQPGVIEFFKRIPREVLTGIASASRIKTTILPILEAHAATGDKSLLERIGTLIVGEDNLMQMMGNDPKPGRKFYENALITGAHILHREGRMPRDGIPVEDMVIIGDQIAKSSTPDAPVSRKGASHIVLMPDKDIDAVGPLSAVVLDMATLNNMTLNRTIANPVIRRLSMSLVA